MKVMVQVSTDHDPELKCVTYSLAKAGDWSIFRIDFPFGEKKHARLAKLKVKVNVLVNLYVRHEKAQIYFVSRLWFPKSTTHMDFLL